MGIMFTMGIALLGMLIVLLVFYCFLQSDLLQEWENVDKDWMIGKTVGSVNR